MQFLYTFHGRHEKLQPPLMFIMDCLRPLDMLFIQTDSCFDILFHSLRTLGCGLLAYFAWQHLPKRHICIWSRPTTRGSSSKVRGRTMLQLFVQDMRALLNLAGFDIPIKSSHRPLLWSDSSSLTKFGTILMLAARAPLF